MDLDFESGGESLALPHDIDVGPEIEQFANAVDDCINPNLTADEKHERVLELPQRFYDNTGKRFADLKRQYGKFDRAQAIQTYRPEGTLAELETWDLMRRLMPLRKASPERLEEINAASSEGRTLVNEFFRTTPLAAERRAIIQWLQATDARLADIQTDDDTIDGSGPAHGRLHTRSAIKLRKNVASWPHLLEQFDPNTARTHVTKDGDQMVTHLDPDATTRQHRKLENEDNDYEKGTYTGLLRHLRRGSKMKTLRDWCQDRGELGRAVSMSAALFLSEDENEPMQDLNATNWLIWRRTCLETAKRCSANTGEQAVYGLLAGDYESVKAELTDWTDLLFASYNALLWHQFDDFLLKRVDADFAAQISQMLPAPAAPAHLSDHGDPTELDARIVKSLGPSPSPGEAQQPFRELQKSIISRTAYNYFEVTGTEREETSDAPVTELRVLSHVLVILEQCGLLSPPPPEAYNILANYMHYLGQAGMRELIPQYASMLPEKLQYEALRINLIADTDQETRGTLLRLMKKANIHIGQYVRAQAGMSQKLATERMPETSTASEHQGKLAIIKEGQLTSDFFESEDDVAPEYQNVVRALEWLMMVDDTWPDLLAFGSNAYKFFLDTAQLGAARHLLECVTFADVTTAMGISLEDLEADMLDDVSFWATQLDDLGIHNVNAEDVATNARNFRDLEAVVRLLDNLETMGSLITLSQEAPASNRDYWTKVGTEIKATTASVQPLLAGWLLTGSAAGDEELASVREMYITEVILAYISALHFVGTSLSRDYLLECLDLSATIAEGESDLQISFMKAGRMTELVEAFAAVSKSLAMKQGSGGGSSSKKASKKGWDRNIWTVKA